MLELEKKPKNLLKNKFINNLFKSRLFPGVFQWVALVVFAFIIFQTLWGPSSAHDNFGTAATWIFWWPMIPIVFLLLGRFWCAICPFATVSDLFQKFFGANLAVPRFLKRYGIWIIDILFVLITWSDHVFGVVESPRGSGYLLMLIFTGVVVAAVFFERRTWCRYLCFLGGLSGNYSRAGMLELRATPEVCKDCKTQACYKGGDKAPGCPMFEFPRTMDSNAKCNFCGHCVKNCENDSLRLSVRPPAKELWYVRKPKLEEAFLAVIIMGIVFVQNFTMLTIWPPILEVLEKFAGTDSYFVTFSITFVIAMALPILALTITSIISGKLVGEKTWTNFAKFGYAIIPLDLAAHVAHNLFHLLAEGLNVVYTAMALFGMESHGASPAIFSNETIQIMQFALIALGMFGSVYTAYRIAKSNYGETGMWKGVIPYFALIIVLGLINVVLFYLPMAMRM